MKKTHDTLPPEQTVADLAHLAWCALVGLRLTQCEGMSHSSLATHSFLLRWLAMAQKQKRFPRTVAADIDSLVVLGRKKAPLLFWKDDSIISGLPVPVRYCNNPIYFV